MTGKALHEKLLNRYHLQMEMVSADYVLAMTAVGDSRDGLSTAAAGVDRN